MVEIKILDKEIFSHLEPCTIPELVDYGIGFQIKKGTPQDIIEKIHNYHTKKLEENKIFPFRQKYFIADCLLMDFRNGIEFETEFLQIYRKF